MSLRIVALNQNNQGVLINLNDIFMSDFAQLGLGHFDSSRSVWHKVKAFPKNLELQVQATYTGGSTGDDSIDERGKTIVVHYGLVDLPEGGYSAAPGRRPRRPLRHRRQGFLQQQQGHHFRPLHQPLAAGARRDDRRRPAVGARRRRSSSTSKRPVPHEYRSAVQEGILEWNKAFEKIGFRNAIEVVQQRDEEDFDPEDMNYNTFRWITTDQGFAMGPSRANPLTGEILDADIIFDASFIRFWKQERQILRVDGKEYEPVSPIQAMDLGWGLNHSILRRNTGAVSWDDRPQRLSPNASRLSALRQGVCQCPNHMKMELGMAALALADAVNAPKPKEKDKDAKDKKKDKDAKDKEKEAKEKEKDKVLDELIHQAIKHIVMHEVGHTLGLRHNFKGSTMLANNQLHDTKITREKGLVGSVMDYSPVNLAPRASSRAITSAPPSARTTTGRSSTPTSRSAATRRRN